MHNAFVLVAQKPFVIDRVIKVTHDTTDYSICLEGDQSACKRKNNVKCGTKNIVLFLEGTLERFCCITNEQT